MGVEPTVWDTARTRWWAWEAVWVLVASGSDPVCVCPLIVREAPSCCPQWALGLPTRGLRMPSPPTLG